MNSVVFLQKRSHKAGAQVCLARLLCHEAIRAFHPVLICSQKGWLPDECARQGIQFLVEPFPNSRSLAGLLFKNSAFARAVAAKARPSIIQANDHQEGLLGLELAKATGAKTAIFLRSSGMSREDYFKYKCNEYAVIMAVGKELQARVQSWDPSKKIILVQDGIYDSEFLPPKSKPPRFPKKILVLGSELPDKGWPDVIAALGQFSGLELDFTGSKPADLVSPSILRTNFIGRVENFRDLVRQYDLILNPSRHESFGMAAIEVLAAGVPLLSSRTGVIEKVITTPSMLFLPNDPADLAKAMTRLMTHWNSIDPNILGSQKSILKQFNMDLTAKAVVAAWQELIS